MSRGLWNTLELFAEAHPPAAVLAEWQHLMGGEFASVSRFLRPTQRLAREYPCLGEPDCGCRHEVDDLDDGRWIASCRCGFGDCPPSWLAPCDLILHELDAVRFGGAVARTLGFDAAENHAASDAAPKIWPAGTYAVTRSPVYLGIFPSENQLMANVEGLAGWRQEPFLLLSPTANLRSAVVDSFLARLHCGFIPLAQCAAPDGPGEFRVTRSIQPMLERFAAGLTSGKALVRTVEKIGRDLEAVAQATYQLRQENEELKRLQAEGFFKFAVRVDGADFRAFAVIMALGNRNAAADFLKIPPRSLYDRVEKWQTLGRDHQRMFRLVEWRKRSGRKLKVRLEESLQSGDAGELAENPETLQEMIDQLKGNDVDSRDYPAVLRQIMEALQSQNVRNWQSVRDELIEIVREEVPQ